MKTKGLELPFNVDEDDTEFLNDELFNTLCEWIACTHIRLHDALVAAGYTAIRIEKKQTHPVWDIRATLPPKAHDPDPKLLKRQFRKLLKTVNLPVNIDEILVMPRGRRVHISFIHEMGPPVVMSHGIATLTKLEPVPEYDLD